MAYVQKLCRSKLQEKRYAVKLTEIFLAATKYASDEKASVDEEDDDDGIPLNNENNNNNSSNVNDDVNSNINNDVSSNVNDECEFVFAILENQA